MFVLPDDVRAWLIDVFGVANHAVASHLTKVPHVYEPSLDTTLISSINPHAHPVTFASDWLVRIDTHFLGGGRHWGRWEIADIGVLIMFRRSGKLLRSKVALLQSKKLYPNEKVTKNSPDYIGFGRLHESDTVFAAAVAPRTFIFKDNSRYKALQINDEQYQAIIDYENLSDIPVFYLLYNPLRVPAEVAMPAVSGASFDESLAVGCRVLPSYEFRSIVAPIVDGRSPSYGDVCSFKEGTFSLAENKGGWKFEHFVVDLLLGCRQGYIADDQKDKTLANLFGGRSAPIYAAISITVDAPANAALIESES